MSTAAPSDEMVPEGLPDHLPQGERLLWQGRPATWPLTVHAFRFGWVAAYFAVLMVWRFVAFLYDGASVVDALRDAAWILPLAAAALVLLALLGWASAKTARYTLTDRRVVLRIGVALSVTVNLPFSVIQSASVRRNADGSGDIAFELEPGTRAAWAVLWPHTRPFYFARPQPSLRAIADVDLVAAKVSAALGSSLARKAAPRAEAAGRPGFVAAAE
jgi:hypothetical protein